MKKIIILIMVLMILVIITSSASCKNKTDLVSFLRNDTTNSHIYTYPSFTCIRFSEMLISRLNSAGFNSCKFIARSPHKKGHIMVFVYCDDGNVLIEPQTDQIWYAGDNAGKYIYDLLGYNPTIIRVNKK